MLNAHNNQPVKVAILDISTQNKAILEYFFSEAGKSDFKEVSYDDAACYIIDYDSPGAKENWKSIFKETQKPGIIISIKEVVLPSCIWIAKPLTVQALKNAGSSILEMMQAEPTSEPSKKEKDTATEETLEQPSEEFGEDAIGVAIEQEIEKTEIELIEALKESPPLKEVAEFEIDKIISEAQIETEVDIEEKVLEPALEIAGTSVEASATHFTVSAELINIDNSLNDVEALLSDIDTTIESSIEELKTDDIDDFSVGNNTEDSSFESSSIEVSSLQDKDNNEIDGLLSTLTSDDEDTEGSDTQESIDIFSLEAINLNNADSDIDLDTSIPKQNIIDKDNVPPVFETSSSVDGIEVDNSVENEDSNPTEIDKAERKSAEEELQSLLEEIRLEADGNSPKTNLPKNSPRSYAPTNAEERWKLTCGENKDVKKINSLCTYTPDDHVLASLLDTIKQLKKSKQISRVKFLGVVVVIDPISNTVYCDHSIHRISYANICFEPIKKAKVKTHKLDTSEVRLYLNKMQTEPDYTHSIESFIWTTSLVTSRGRLPINTDVNQKIGMRFWPNMTRIETIPNAMQIAAAFHKGEGSLSSIPNEIGAPQRHVIAFYNAALSLGAIKNQGSSTVIAPAKKTNNKTSENKGFFSRILKKLMS